MRSVAKDRTLPENLLSLDPTHHHVDFRLPHSEQASRSPRSRIGWSAPRRCVSWAVRLDPRIHSMPSRYVPGLANPEVPFASSSEGDFDDRESAGLSSSAVSGTGICSLQFLSHLVAVICTRPLCTFLSTPSRFWSDGLPSPWSAAGSKSAPKGPGGERIILRTLIPERARAILSSSLQSHMAATSCSSRVQIHLRVSGRSQ